MSVVCDYFKYCLHPISIEFNTHHSASLDKVVALERT